MAHQVKIVDDRAKPRMIGTVGVPRAITIPTCIRRGRATDVLRELLGAAGLFVLSGPVKRASGFEYVVAMPRSVALPGADDLKHLIEEVLTFYLPCLEYGDRESSFVDIDSARPNVASKVFASCLMRRSALSRRLMVLIQVWLRDELTMKWPMVVSYYDEQLLVGTPRPTRKEIRDLEATVETRQIYLELIEMAERGKWKEALARAKHHHFV